MPVYNRTYTIESAHVSGDLFEVIEKRLEADPVRWFVSKADSTKIVVESTESDEPVTRRLPLLDAAEPGGRDVVVNLLPTGVGCEIGGYAGDAAPITALLGSSADLLVTNPNAVNASNFIFAQSNVMYTEGFSIDLLMQGKAVLHRPRSNRIGVIIEGGDHAAISNTFNVINAVRAVYGIDVVDCIVTSSRIGTRCVRNASGAYVGGIDRPDVLLQAAQQLTDKGADAIAVTTNVQDLPSGFYEAHFRGEHPNPVGGAEAIVSHLVTRTLAMPCAHAPMVNSNGMNLSRELPDEIVDARSAGEFVSSSGLACVLVGLRRAPRLMKTNASPIVASVGLNDVIAVVAPAAALGGIPVLQAARLGIPVIGVRHNRTILEVTKEGLGLADVICVESYAEAAGVILALRNGISLDTIKRPLHAFGV